MEREDVTRLVSRLRSGDRTAFDALLGLTYQELRQLARGHLRRERSDHTLNPTALVHEVWMRLSQQRDHSFDNRAHFFGAVSHAMRRVLVDHARGRRARKRRGERVPLTAVDEGITAPPSVDDVIAVDAALDALSMLNERLLRVVECRIFAGFTIYETARALGVSHTTVSEDWRFARAWLHRALSGVSGDSALSRD
jgi:RNA polymerase sigma factor (TIGR02999 family)